MATKKAPKREIIDVIEYFNTNNVAVVITLVQYGPYNFTVETKIGNMTTTRGFASERQANDFIVNSQR